MILAEVWMLWLTGPDHQTVAINPYAVVSTRAPRSTEHFGKGVKCLVHTIDGKYVAVIETCAVVNQRLEEGE